MKPPPFAYHRAGAIDEALVALGSSSDAKVLAGGQSLLPLLNFRLARPALLVDINEIDELNRIYERDGGVAVGATVRQRDAELSPIVARVCPLLSLGLKLVAHVTIRNRGTVCGSLAHADPASELCAILLATGGHVVARSLRASRTIPADRLFVGPLETILAPDELITEAWFPTVEGRVAIAEESRRNGDFAMAGAVLAGERLALFGVAPTAVLADPRHPTRGLSPTSDIDASAEFKLHLVEILVEQVIT